MHVSFCRWKYFVEMKKLCHLMIECVIESIRKANRMYHWLCVVNVDCWHKSGITGLFLMLPKPLLSAWKRLHFVFQNECDYSWCLFHCFPLLEYDLIANAKTCSTHLKIESYKVEVKIGARAGAEAADIETVIIYGHFTSSCLVNNLFYSHL